MTEYHTAERTATTPLHVSTTPHLAYLLMLLALLAADILTTVWFTRLGLPELNPHIAPIAGSVAAQVAYKAPFAVALAGGTALLAAACDRLRPPATGSGPAPGNTRGWPWSASTRSRSPGTSPRSRSTRASRSPRDHLRRGCHRLGLADRDLPGAVPEGGAMTPRPAPPYEQSPWPWPSARSGGGRR